eukprot:5343981-Prymnesium_polylepis.1
MPLQRPAARPHLPLRAGGLAGARGRAGAGTASCGHSVTHELAIGDVIHGGLNGSSLAAQELRRLRLSTVFSSRIRAVPFEPNPQLDAARLAQEFNETWLFQEKQLKKDPRIKPEDIEPTYDHMAQCTACQQRASLTAAIHGSSAAALVDVSSDWQLLADDFVIDTWRNIVRFLNPPLSQRVVMSPRRKDFARFGCPCSVWQPRERNDSFKLYYSSGQTAGTDYRYVEWPKEMRLASSDDGVNWGHARDAESVILDGGRFGMTGTFTAVAQAPGEGPYSLAGYEGANSKACLARSLDGEEWTTIPTGNPVVSARYVSKPRLGVNRSYDTPVHLQKSKYFVRANREFHRVCSAEIRICERRGIMWGHKGQMVACLLALLNEDIMRSDECRDVMTVRFNLEPIDCTDGTKSRLGRAADAYVQPIYDGRRHLVWYRRDFGGPGGWREIRGVQVVEADRSMQGS